MIIGLYKVKFYNPHRRMGIYASKTLIFLGSPETPLSRGQSCKKERSGFFMIHFITIGYYNLYIQFFFEKKETYRRTKIECSFP